MIYNDFTNIMAGRGSEISGPKADVVFNMVKKLKQENLVDEVGLQMHIFDPATVPSEEEIISQIERYEKIGVPVNFTELDVNIKPLLDRNIKNALLKQAQIYERIVRACIKAKNCRSINIWGLNDNESWLGPDSKALLFDSNQPKISLFAISRALFDTLYSSQP